MRVKKALFSRNRILTCQEHLSVCISPRSKATPCYPSSIYASNPSCCWTVACCSSYFKSSFSTFFYFCYLNTLPHTIHRWLNTQSICCPPSSTLSQTKNSVLFTYTHSPPGNCHFHSFVIKTKFYVLLFSSITHSHQLDLSEIQLSFKFTTKHCSLFSPAGRSNYRRKNFYKN